MRCFIAIDVPEDISDKLKELQKKFENLDSITFPKIFHLTLKFLGEISEEQVEDVKNSLRRVKFKPFDLELTEIGSFPDDKRINVLWVGVESADNVIGLQQEIEQNLNGFSKDLRFHPHVTIGRVKFVKDKEGIRRLLKSKVEGKFRAENFKLIKSELMPEGPRYTNLGVYS